MFTKILIANRGEVAVRIIRACREMGIATVALYEPSDQSSLHIRLADECIQLDSPADFFDQAKLIAIAQERQAQAIHPGYGFLAEEASFIRACDAAAITLSVHDNWPIEVLFQHDEAHLYVAYTGLDADPVAVFPELFLDSNPDTQEIWDGNNWWFHLSTGPCWGQGNNLLWQTCGQPSNWNSTTFVQNSGVIEMQIPYRTINLSAGSNKNIGFLVSLFSLTDVDEEQRQLWPSTSDWEKPPTWGIAQPEDNW